MFPREGILVSTSLPFSVGIRYISKAVSIYPRVVSVAPTGTFTTTGLDLAQEVVILFILLNSPLSLVKKYVPSESV